jgi:hypothetical protein
MSDTLLAMVDSYLASELSPEDFVEQFIAQWKAERDSGIYKADPAKLSELLSTIFCLADLFNATDDREDYELDDENLRLRIQALLKDGGWR